MYLSAAHTVSFAANGVFEGSFNGGMVLGAPTGSFKGVGTLNATGLYVNGTAITITGFANPSALVGLSAVNGSATTAMRSDSAPALDQSISPTWTGTHTFSGTGITTTFAGKVVIGAPSSGASLLVNILNNVTNALEITDGTTQIGFDINSGHVAEFGTVTNHDLHLFTNNSTRITIANTGNVTIAAPSSGTILTLDVLDGTVGVDIQGGVGTSGYFQRYASNGGTVRGYIGNGAVLWNTGAVTDWGITTGSTGTLRLGANGNFALSIAQGGNVTIAAPSSGDALTSTGISSGYAATFNAAGGTQRGVQIIGGSAGTDINLICKNSGGGTNLFLISGQTTANTVQGYGPTAAALVDMTPDKGTFTGTLTGCTSSPTVTCTWSRIGNLVVLNIGALTATSNATTCSITGLPAAIQPASLAAQYLACLTEDNGTIADSTVSIQSGSGTIQLYKAGSVAAASFTNTGTKGIPAACTVAYLLN